MSIDQPTHELLVSAWKREQLRLTQITTYWDGCWRHHLTCAENKVGELEKRIAELERALRQVQPDTQHYKDGDGGCFIDCPYCTIEQALKGGGE